MTEDTKAFGENAWVYCRQHCKPHLTGWCTVGNQDKIGLGLVGQENAKAALEKCREWGFEIYSDRKIA